MRTDIVGPEHIGKMVNKCGLQVRSGSEQYAASCIFFGNLTQVLCCMVQGLLPGNPLPFAFASFTCP